jgi:hypothetical protein
MQQFGCSSLGGLGGLKIRPLAVWCDVYRLMTLVIDPCRGVAKLVKALDFDSSMQRFESFLPCQIFIHEIFGGSSKSHFALPDALSRDAHAGS